MSKAGKGDSVDAGAVGSQHPVPENIPHLSSPVQNASSASVSAGAGGSTGSLPKHAHHGSIAGIQAGSPVKESSFLNRETSIDDEEGKQAVDQNPLASSEPLGGGEGLPIRR
jgi:hypothetical protein